MGARAPHPDLTEEHTEACTALPDRTRPRSMCGRESEPGNGLRHAGVTLYATCRLESGWDGRLLPIRPRLCRAQSITGLSSLRSAEAMCVRRVSSRPSPTCVCSVSAVARFCADSPFHEKASRCQGVNGSPRSGSLRRSSPWPRFHSHSLVSPSGLGARWGPTDPGAANCSAGLSRPPGDVRPTEGKRAVARDRAHLFLQERPFRLGFRVCAGRRPPSLCDRA